MGDIDLCIKHTVEGKTIKHNENLNVLKQIGEQINDDSSETEVDNEDKVYFYDEGGKEKPIQTKGQVISE